MRFYAVSFLSLRLFAYAKSHLPRQREARAVIKFSSLQTPIVRLKANKLCISLIFVLLQSLFFYFLRLIRLLGCCVFYSPLKFYDCIFTFNQLIIFVFGRFFRFKPEAYPEIGIIDAALMSVQLHYCRNYRQP